MKQARICVITGGPLSSSPRVVREADCLAQAGYETHVIGFQTLAWQDAWDDDLMKRRRWRSHLIRAHASSLFCRWKWRSRRRRGVSAMLAGKNDTIQFADAFAPWHEEALAYVQKIHPDLVIAHTPAGMALALWIQERLGVPFGIDLEDFHCGEQSERSRQNHLHTLLMRRGLAQARYVTASSPPIIEETRKRFGRSDFTSILNAYEPSVSPGEDPSLFSMFWVSQTLGPNRGLEDVIRACGRLEEPFSLVLQGRLLPSYQRALKGLIVSAGIQDRVTLEPWCASDDLPTVARRHHVGLALEPGSNENSRLCISNKILLYAASGLAIVASHTRGHEWVFRNAPGIGFLYAPGNVDELAEGLQHWMNHRDALQAVRERARRAAHEVLSWERQSAKFLDLIQQAVSK